MSKYDDLDRDSLVRLLQRRDAERQLGLVWERDIYAGEELEADAAMMCRRAGHGQLQPSSEGMRES